MGCSSFIFASPVHFYCFLSLRSSIDCMMGLVHSFLNWKDTSTCNKKYRVFWKATLSKFKQTPYSFGSLRQFLPGRLLMQAQFCHRLKAESKGRFEPKKKNNLWLCFSTLLFLSKTKKKKRLKFNKWNSDIISKFITLTDHIRASIMSHMIKATDLMHHSKYFKRNPSCSVNHSY